MSQQQSMTATATNHHHHNSSTNNVPTNVLATKSQLSLKPINISIGGTNHYILKAPGGAIK